MCQPNNFVELTRLQTRYKFDEEELGSNPNHTLSRNFENMVMLHFKRIRPDCEIEGFLTAGTQKRLFFYLADAFFGHCNSSFEFEAMDCLYHAAFLRRHDRQ